MNLNHLKYFKEVCECGSITAASEKCHVSQPSITSAIGNLEKETGVKLFGRVGNRLSLTEDGREFLRLTADFIDKYDDYFKNVCDISENKIAKLKLGVPSVMGTFLFEKIIPGFENENPNVRLEVFETGSIAGISMLKSDGLDCVIGLSDGEKLPGVCAKKLFSTELMLAINKDHPYAKEKLATKKIISELPLIIVTKGTYHHRAITGMYPDVELNVVMHSNQVSTIRKMLTENHAATIIYKEVFADCDDIVYIPLEKKIVADIDVFWRSDRYVQKALKRFVLYMERQC